MSTNIDPRRAGTPARVVAALLLAALLIVAGPALAAEPAGRVLTTTGVVTATNADGFTRPLSRNDVVYPGEVLSTGPGGRVQVRFRDDALVDLRPSTEFEIERYLETSEDEGGSAILNLLKGALRTITGAIGKDERDEYAVETPVATIGIRGTDYSLEFCDAACAGSGRRPGLYGRVDDGSIVAETGGGTSPFSTGDYFFIPQGGIPQRIIAPPKGILLDDENDDSEGKSTTDDELQDMTITEEQDGESSTDITALGSKSDGPNYVAGDDLIDSEDLELDSSELTLLDGALVATAYTGLDPDNAEVRSTSSMLSPSEQEAFVGPEGQITQLDRSGSTFADLSDATLQESRTSDIGGMKVSWGRWAGSYSAGGDAIDGGFTYAYTDAANLSTADDLGSLSVTMSYGSPKGPHGVDQDGMAWSVDQFTFNANFGSGILSFGSLELSRVDGGWNFALDGTHIQNEDFNRSANSFRFDFGGRGEINGRFLGRTAGGAIARFDVADSDGVNRVVGVQVLTGGAL